MKDSEQYELNLGEVQHDAHVRDCTAHKIDEAMKARDETIKSLLTESSRARERREKPFTIQRN